MENSFSGVCKVPYDHPTIEGHFPGDPIVPGVVLLDRVLQLLRNWEPGIRVSGLTQTKFLSPLRPGQEFLVFLTRTQPGRIRFECLVDSKRLATGLLTLNSIK